MQSHGIPWVEYCASKEWRLTTHTEGNIVSNVGMAIVSDVADQIIRDIAGLSHISNYAFRDRATDTVEEQCFDTTGGDLREKALELLRRRIGSKALIKLGPLSQDEEGNDSQKTEFLHPWTGEGLRVVIERLHAHGIAVNQPAPSFHHMEALDQMTRLGFTVIQDRTTHRRVRDIFCLNERGTQVKAEFVLESVTYAFLGTTIRHHQVGFKSRTPDGPFVVAAILDMFSDIYKDALRAWNKSTSMTGAAIEMLLKEGDLGAMGKSQSLPSSAYDKMSAKLIQAGFRS